MNEKINNLYLRIEKILGDDDGELHLGSAIIINAFGIFISFACVMLIYHFTRIRYALLIGNGIGMFLGALFILLIIFVIYGIISCYEYFTKKTAKYCAKIRVEDGFYVKIKETVMEEK